MAVGIGINEGRDLYDSFTTGLFEIGALFFIEKFFFLASDDEKIIKALRVRWHRRMSYRYSTRTSTGLHKHTHGHTQS